MTTRSSATRSSDDQRDQRDRGTGSGRKPRARPGKPTTTHREPQQSMELSTEQWLIHRADILHYVCHLLDGDIHAAEDVTQEATLRLWQHPEVHAPGRSLTPWLRTVAHNIVVDRYRRIRARPPEVNLAAELDPESARATINTSHDGHLAFEDVESAAVVENMLSCLSPKHRAAVVAVYVQGRAINDVAVRLGIPPGTVKSRCSNAIRQLQQALRVSPRSRLAA